MDSLSLSSCPFARFPSRDTSSYPIVIIKPADAAWNYGMRTRKGEVKSFGKRIHRMRMRERERRYPSGLIVTCSFLSSASATLTWLLNNYFNLTMEEDEREWVADEERDELHTFPWWTRNSRDNYGHLQLMPVLFSFLVYVCVFDLEVCDKENETRRRRKKERMESAGKFNVHPFATFMIWPFVQWKKEMRGTQYHELV